VSESAVPTAQDYLVELRKLADARAAFAMGLIDDEQFDQVVKDADRKGHEWDLHCRSCAGEKEGWKGK
jgi:hypothetical protein